MAWWMLYSLGIAIQPPSEAICLMLPPTVAGRKAAAAWPTLIVRCFLEVEFSLALEPILEFRPVVLIDCADCELLLEYLDLMSSHCSDKDLPLPGISCTKWLIWFQSWKIVPADWKSATHYCAGIRWNILSAEYVQSNSEVDKTAPKN